MAPMMKSVVVALAALVALMGSTEAVTMRGLSAMEDRELATSSTTCITSCQEHAVLLDSAKDKTCLTQYSDCKCQLPTLGNGYCKGAVKTVQTGTYTATCEQTLTPCSASPTSSVTQPVTSSMECISSCPANSVVKDAAKNKSCLNQITDCSCTLPKLGNGYCSGAVKGVITGSNTMRCDQTLTPCASTPSSPPTVSPTPFPTKCIRKCPRKSIRTEASAGKTCINQMTDCVCQLPANSNPLCTAHVQTIQTGTNTMKCQQSKTCTKSG